MDEWIDGWMYGCTCMYGLMDDTDWILNIKTHLNFMR